VSFRLCREIEVAAAVARAHLGFIVGAVKQLAGVFAHRLEHQHARLLVRARRA